MAVSHALCKLTASVHTSSSLWSVMLRKLTTLHQQFIAVSHVLRKLTTWHQQFIAVSLVLRKQTTLHQQFIAVSHVLRKLTTLHQQFIAVSHVTQADNFTPAVYCDQSCVTQADNFTPSHRDQQIHAYINTHTHTQIQPTSTLPQMHPPNHTNNTQSILHYFIHPQVIHVATKPCCRWTLPRPQEHASPSRWRDGLQTTTMQAHHYGLRLMADNTSSCGPDIIGITTCTVKADIIHTGLLLQWIGTKSTTNGEGNYCSRRSFKM